MSKELGSVLDEAKTLIQGKRREQYGDPTDSFKKIANLWSVVFNKHVAAKDVALAMICLKVCRELNTHSEDNLVDICGYAALADNISNEAAEPMVKDKDIDVKELVTLAGMGTTQIITPPISPSVKPVNYPQWMTIASDNTKKDKSDEFDFVRFSPK